jgi:protein-tyrosine phosphatase
MRGFYWLIDGELAGCPCPGRIGLRGPDYLWSASPIPAPSAAGLDDDLAWLREQGIGALLTLTEEPLPADALARNGLEGLHIPVTDMSAPTPRQFEEALAFIDRMRAAGRPVAVHCLMGQGRTGTILAAYLIRAGASADEAVARVRAVCHGAICAPVQEDALRAFARQREWIV